MLNQLYVLSLKILFFKSFCKIFFKRNIFYIFFFSKFRLLFNLIPNILFYFLDKLKINE